MPKVYLLNQAYPQDCDILRQVRSEHSQRVYFLNRGYITYYIDQQTKPFEHRLVADKAFGGIPDGYHVHHINGIVNDNRSVNLEMLSASEHARLHHGYSVIVACSTCGDPVEVKHSQFDRYNSQYCSKRCRGIGQRKAERPTPEYLLHLLTTVGNWCEIAKMYNVSDNAVRKWAISYNLDLSICDGRKSKGWGSRI